MGSDFTFANCTNSHFDFADLSGTTLTGADFTGSVLQGAVFTNAILTGMIVGDSADEFENANIWNLGAIDQRLANKLAGRLLQSWSPKH